MPKTKVRTTVSVAVEDFDAAAPRVEAIETPVIEQPAFRSDLGFWWECLSGLVLVQALLNLLFSSKVIFERSDICVALLLTAASIVAAIMTGKYAGRESIVRKILGFGLVGLGFCLGIASLVMGSLPGSSLVTYAAIGSTITGWAVRRLLGESYARSLSLGLVAAAPLLMIEGGFAIGPSVLAIRSFAESMTFWFVGMLADLYLVPFTPIDAGLKFASGDLVSTATFNNMAGLLVAIAASVAFSVLRRHSLIVALLCVLAAYLWWSLFRAFYCLQMNTNRTLDGPLSELAMPFFSLIGLLLLIVATNVAIGSVLAVIPIDPASFDISPLTLLYNAFVSFPQLGPAPNVILSDQTKDSPLTKEEMILDEYRRAKEAAQLLDEE